MFVFSNWNNETKMQSPGRKCMKKHFYYKRNRKDKSIVGIIKAYHSTKAPQTQRTHVKTRERERLYNHSYRSRTKTPAAQRTNSAAPQSQSIYKQCTGGP